jgi:hypothetical protein
MTAMKASTRRFIRHYIEMVVVMMLGMFALGAPANAVIDTSGRTGLMLAEMAVTMTLPMVASSRCTCSKDRYLLTPRSRSTRPSKGRRYGSASADNRPDRSGSPSR